MPEDEEEQPQPAEAEPAEQPAVAVTSTHIEDEMKQSYLLYSMSVIVARALPDVRDGLKPAQRRILVAMNDLNLTPTSQPRKSAKISGDTSGNYHPHGDQVIYPTLVRMVQPFNSRYPLVLGQGNFGSVDGDPPAAQRYTEVRLSPISMELLADLEKNTVDWIPNYDQTRQEPTVLPSRLPNMVVNGASGIAVGMATNMPPHNLREVCDATIRLIENPQLTPDDLLETMQGPDFPTHGYILGRKGIRSYFNTGRGSVVMQARVQIDEMENGKHAIIITELPYQVNKRRLQEQIADLVKQKKIDGITDIKDFTNKEGMRVVVELRRDAHPQKVLNYLLKHTALRSSFGVMMLALVDGAPRLLNMVQAIKHYLRHRHEVIRRRTRFELDKAEARLHIVEGLRRAIDVIDEIIALIRASSSPTQARDGLMETFGFSQVQAQFILDMQLRALTRLERDRLEKEYAELLKLIERLRMILADPKQIDILIREDLKEVRDRLGDDRRTRILNQEADEIGNEDLIPEEETIVTITRQGYIRRVPADTFRVQHRGGRGVRGVGKREADDIAHLFVATTHHYILFFTDRGRVYRVKAYEVPQTSRTAMGTPVINLINIEPGERVTATIPMASLDQEGYLVMATVKGEVKRTALAEFKNLRANGLISFDIEEDDSLNWVHLCQENDEFFMITDSGQAIRFPVRELRVASRHSGGVRGMRLQAKSRVVAAAPVEQGSDVLVIGTRGYGKRTPEEQFSSHHRGGSGIIALKVTSKTGPVATACMVRDDDTLLVGSTEGQAVHIPVAQIRRTGRSAEGVKIMTLDENEQIAVVERAHREGEAPLP